MTKILLVEDEAGVRFGIREFLRAHEFAVEEADSAAGAEAAFREFRPDAAVIDYLLPDGNALDLLPRLREIESSVPVVILTGHGSIDLAVRAIKEGAEQFLTKPVELPALLIVLRRLLEDQRVRRTQLAGRARESRVALDPFVGTSAAIRRLADEATKVLSTESPILIQGETGTGKSVLARWLHDHGPRADEAFVDLNCASLSREFLETELFGHEKGAFTGAAARKPGLLEIAHRGTVFLDEIGDMDLAVQPKLLTVLEEKRFRRMGSVRDQRVDVKLTGSRVGGSVQLKQGGGATVGTSHINGDLQFEANRASLSATKNDIGGSLQAFQNTGGLVIKSNTIDGNLQCKENSPPPTGGGNVVQGNEEDQCARL